jgi:hypothetical protein
MEDTKVGGEVKHVAQARDTVVQQIIIRPAAILVGTATLVRRSCLSRHVLRRFISRPLCSA